MHIVISLEIAHAVQYSYTNWRTRKATPSLCSAALTRSRNLVTTEESSPFSSHQSHDQAD